MGLDARRAILSGMRSIVSAMTLAAIFAALAFGAPPRSRAASPAPLSLELRRAAYSNAGPYPRLDVRAAWVNRTGRAIPGEATCYGASDAVRAELRDGSGRLVGEASTIWLCSPFQPFSTAVSPGTTVADLRFYFHDTPPPPGSYRVQLVGGPAGAAQFSGTRSGVLTVRW